MKYIFKSVFLLTGVVLSTLLFNQTCFAANTISNIEISPNLEITRFDRYKIYADITGSPSSVSIELNGINGDLDPADPMVWDYYVDGTPASSPKTLNMTYNASLGKWESDNIYPDYIYPEIIFEESEVYWYNTPSNKTLQRSNYQLLHYTNSFTPVGEMTFFIEINAVPRGLNSSDLEVYLVKKGKTSNFFTSDWRNSPDVELVGTIANTETFHHSHTDISSHHLIPLSANPDGTFGTKNLDISDDFWVIIYSQSPNNNRGWDFKYQSSCDNSGMWYSGSQIGWTVSAQTGCPDTHIHISRRDEIIRDGVKAEITADYGGGGTISANDSFYFFEPPNLAPNSTSFISPVVGGIYDGGVTEELSVSWDPATDPNNDSILYTIYLLNENEAVIDTLIANTANTSFTWDISSVNNGTYKLKGVITENIPTNPLSTEFYTDGFFSINKSIPLYSLNSVSISSNNADSTKAKAGDDITLAFTATGTINSPAVEIYSGGVSVNDSVTVTNTSGNNWTASYTVNPSDTDGPVSFSISTDNLDKTYYDTTDDTSTVVDTTNPSDPVATPNAGTYNTGQNIALSASGSNYIKYTTNGSTPDCSTGTTYAGAIAVSSPTTIKAIACDSTGNYSNIGTFAYAFQYTITFNGNGGIGHSPATALVNHGDTTSLPSNPTRTGYTFTGWNTQAGGGGSVFDGTTVVTSNATVYAQWTINNYTLTYYGNGHDGGDPHPAENHNYGTSVTIKNQNTLTKTGYTFNGWNTASNGSGTGYQTDDEISIAGDMNLYAQWTENAKCTVTFNGNGGSGQTPGSKTIDCGLSLAGATESMPTNPGKTGYTFTSWNTASNGSGSTFNINTTINSNITAYAIWTGNSYTINFDAQGGTANPTSKSVTYNSQVGALPTPTKAGYNFDEWNTLANGTGTAYDSSTVYLTSDDLTLYAQWTGNSYTINFDAQGGTVAPGSKAATYNSEVGALPTPTKSGYTFTEWNTASDGNGTTYTSATNYSTIGDLNLYAIWTANTYLLAFNARGGSASDTQSVTYNSTIGTLPTPTKNYYTFAGWYTDINGGGDLFTEATIFNIVDNYLLFANWDPNVYTLNYSAGTGGTLTGTTSQSVSYGSNGTSVTAVANPGYQFISWSDSSTANPRIDTNISGNLNVTAGFGLTGSSGGYLLRQVQGREQSTDPSTLPAEEGTLESTTAEWGLTTANPFFEDISSEHIYYEAIKYLFEKGIIHGYSNNTYQPERLLNRAEISKIAALSTGANPSLEEYNSCFPDVKKEWFAPFICYLKEQNMVHGYLGGEFEGLFKPERSVSKSEMIKILFNSQGIKTEEIINEDPFPDVTKDSWYASFVQEAKDMEIIPSTGENFYPDEKVNRGVTAEYFYRIYKNL